jgi:hypothetical protein
VGRRFWVGEVLCAGTRLCEPCQYLADLTDKPLLHPLVHRGGLRAEILPAGASAAATAYGSPMSAEQQQQRGSSWLARPHSGGISMAAATEAMPPSTAAVDRDARTLQGNKRA